MKRIIYYCKLPSESKKAEANVGYSFVDRIVLFISIFQVDITFSEF